MDDKYPLVTEDQPKYKYPILGDFVLLGEANANLTSQPRMEKHLSIGYIKKA